MYESRPYFAGTGRRKTSVARVRLYNGTGNITVNGRDITDYFGLDTLKYIVRQPLELTNLTGKFDVVFNCKPQRFLVEDTYPTTLTADNIDAETGAAFFWNTSGQPARPLITVYGTAPGTLTIGTVTVKILALTDFITIDCDLMTAYRQVGDAAAENKNADIYAPDFPELGLGKNLISWTGGITQDDITPRGWML